MLKKIIIVSSFILTSVFTPLIIILIACLICLDFFGASTINGYVQGNLAYANDYREVLNENITKSNNGYVSLDRILTFYLAKDNLSFKEIYSDNINTNLGKMIPISKVCSLPKYAFLSECNSNDIKYNIFEEYDTKIFAPPIDFSKATITSFFKEERYVFGKYSVHDAWDFAAPAETEVYSSCGGIVTNISFKYSENLKDVNGGTGNSITIKCNDTKDNYSIKYSHLYPNSAKVKEGDEVAKGQTIAGVGTTGYSTGNHLDWKVYLDNSSIDGMSLVDFRFTEENTNTGGGYIPPYLKDGGSTLYG